MPVNSTHPQYDKVQAQWSRVRDVLAGSDAVKSRGTSYLPKPGGMTDLDYEGYSMRAEFYPATGRTVDGLLGGIFRKDPLVTGTEAQIELLAAVTLTGQDMPTFAKTLVREVLSLGRRGVLVDVVDSDSMPFFASYAAENIINWRVSYINRKPATSLVVLKELRTTQGADEFATEPSEQYRVLQLVLEENSETPHYVQRVFTKTKDAAGKETFLEGPLVVPMRRGEKLTEIPFFFFGPLDLQPAIERSPILDLVDTNLSHFRTSAELEEGAYLTGLPMYVVSGRPQGEEVTEFVVGSRQALLLEEGGSAEVLTVDGDGMGLLTTLIEGKEKRMAVLGARLLEDQKAGVEAAATVAMRHRGEDSLLSSLAHTCSRGLTAATHKLLWWSGVEEPDVSIELNTDFMSAQMSPDDVVKLTLAYQQGTIGQKVFFNALKAGEYLPNEWTMEDWLEDIAKSSPGLEAGLTNDG